MVSEFEISPTINNIEVVKEEVVVQNNITIEPIITILNVVKEETIIEYTITVNPIYEGLPGPRGLNNYELAVANGFEGTYEQWELTQHGNDGKDLTLQDFNASEEVSELSDDAEFFVKEDGVFKRITKENVFQKTDTFHFIITSTGAVNRWFVHNNNQGTFSTTIQTNQGNISDIINKPYTVSSGRKPAGKEIKSVELYITYSTTVFGSNKIRLVIFAKQAVNNVNYDSNVDAIILYDKLITPTGYLKTLYNVDDEIDDIPIPNGYFIQWAMNFENLTSAITIYNSSVIINYK